MWSGDAVSRRRVIAAYLARPSSSWRRSWGGTTAPSRRCTSSGGIGCDAAIPGGAPGWRLALYLGGLVALCRALLSPIDTLGSLLFVVHMTQHELLTMVAPPTILWGRSPALRWRAAGLLRPNARTRRRKARHRARHRVQPSHTSPSVRPRSSRMRRGRTGTAGSASAGVNRSGCARSPVMVRASALGAPSGVQLPELRDGLLHHLAAHALPSGPAASSGGPCRPSAASYRAGTLSSVCAWPRAQVNELGRHYTRRSGPRCAAARTYTPARPATRGRAARTVEVGLGPAAWSPALFEPCPQHPPRRLAPS